MLNTHYRRTRHEDEASVCVRWEPIRRWRRHGDIAQEVRHFVKASGKVSWKVLCLSIKKRHYSGAMGQVYLAQDMETHQKVALKVIKRKGDTGMSLKTILNEINIIKRINHVSIVCICLAYISHTNTAVHHPLSRLRWEPKESLHRHGMRCWWRVFRLHYTREIHPTRHWRVAGRVLHVPDRVGTRCENNRRVVRHKSFRCSICTIPFALRIVTSNRRISCSRAMIDPTTEISSNSPILACRSWLLKECR